MTPLQRLAAAAALPFALQFSACSKKAALTEIEQLGDKGHGAYWIVDMAGKDGTLVISGSGPKTGSGDTELLIVPVPGAYFMLGDVAKSAAYSKEIGQYLDSTLPARPGERPAPSKSFMIIGARMLTSEQNNIQFGPLKEDATYVLRLPVPSLTASRTAACFAKVTHEPRMDTANCLGLRPESEIARDTRYRAAYENLQQQHDTCGELLCELQLRMTGALSAADIKDYLDQRLKTVALLARQELRADAEPAPPGPAAPMRPNPPRPALLLGAVIGVCLLALTATLVLTKAQPDSAAAVPLMSAAKIGGAFTLTDQNGQLRTEKDFRDRYKLIYFGFTYCPAVCPTELQKMAEALRALPVTDVARIKPLFITIDPERDTPAVLKAYITLFDQRLTGLTGTRAQTEAIKQAYKIYAAKVPQGDTYTMDHTSYIYFMTPDDHPVYLFRLDDSAATMADTITAYFKTHK